MPAQTHAFKGHTGVPSHFPKLSALRSIPSQTGELLICLIDREFDEVNPYALGKFKAFLPRHVGRKCLFI